MGRITIEKPNITKEENQKRIDELNKFLSEVAYVNYQNRKAQ